MGSWYENLVGIRKPDWITIEPYTNIDGDVVLLVRLQYNKPHLHTKEIMIDEQVSFNLQGLNASVKKGERWGDWGGPCKCGDVIYVSKKEKRPIDNRPEKVKFT
jgi:hypothetical protein